MNRNRSRNEAGRQRAVVVVVAGLIVLSTVFLPSAKAATLYVSNEATSGHSTIQAFSTTQGQFTFASGFSNPLGLAFNPTGDLFVANGQDHTLYKISPGGTVSTFATGLGFPQVVVCDTSGNLYVDDSGTDKVGTGFIYKLTPAGVRSTFASGLSQPEGMAFDATGNLFEADDLSGNIYKFSPSGVRSTFASGLGGNMTSLAFDSQGNLFMSELLNETIYKFTPSGVKSTFATNAGSEVWGLAFDSNGVLFVAGGDRNAIFEYTPNGVRSTFTMNVSSPRYLAFSPIPEPTTWLLATIGMVNLLVARCRRHGRGKSLCSQRNH